MGRGNFRHNGEIGKEWYIDYDNYRMDDEEGEYVDYDLLYEDENEILRLITEKYHSFHAPEKKYGDNYYSSCMRLYANLIILRCLINITHVVEIPVLIPLPYALSAKTDLDTFK